MKKGIRILALVLVVAVLVAVGAHFLAGRAGLFKNASAAITAPLQSVTTSLVDWLEGVYSYMYEHERLEAENTELKKQVAELQAELRLAGEATEENARLRELMGIKERRADFEFELAKIIEWNASNWASTFTINVGEESGIELGDCVVTEYEALVGQVIELGDSWATVRTVIDVEMSIGALVGEAGNAAMIVGDFSLMQQGCTKLTHLTAGPPIEGDVILTSGKGGVFPQGLVIGTVTAIETEAGGQTPYAVVEPGCELNSLSQVFVVKSFIVAE